MSGFTVYVTPRGFEEAKNLPGHIRQRIKREIKSLAEEPRPSNSNGLEISEFEHELRRLRLERWRVVYTVVEADQAVDVLAIRKPLPYDYGDLKELIKEIEKKL